MQKCHPERSMVNPAVNRHAESNDPYPFRWKPVGRLELAPGTEMSAQAGASFPSTGIGRLRRKRAVRASCYAQDDNP